MEHEKVKISGPLLSDAEFFGKLVDVSLPGMEGVEKAAAVGNYTLCRRLFAAQVRKMLNPKRYFQIPYEGGENQFLFPGETEEAAAERICKLEMVSVGIACQFEGEVDWHANPTEKQYREWTWQFNRHHEWKLLAHQYRLTGREAYAATFVKLFSGWVKQAPTPGDVEGSLTKCWRTIEYGIRMGSIWPYVLFTFYNHPLFTDDLLVDWYKSVWEHGDRLRRNHRTHNWLIMEMNGLAHVGILYPELRQSPEWTEYAFQMLEKEMENQVYPDAFQYELATEYQFAVLNNFARTYRLAKNYGIEVPKGFADKIERMLSVFVKVMKPNGCLPDINDGTGRPASDFIKMELDLFPENKELWWVCENRPSEGAPEYTSVAMEYAGMMIMRNGWSEESTWGFLDAAPFGAAHQHEDKLNFLIHAKGKDILVENGTYAYDDSLMRRYAISTRAHNTVRVNGMDQNRRAAYKWHDEDIKKRADMEYQLTEEYDYVSGVYDEGYGNPGDTAPVYTGVRHQRSVIFLKKPLGGLEPFFIVTDRLFSTDKNEYEWMWHVDADEIAVHGMDVKADFLHIRTSLKDKLTNGVQVVCGQQHPQWQGWKKGETGIVGDIVYLPTVIYTTQAKSVRTVTVFYPGDNCPIVGVEADKSVEATQIQLKFSNGSIVELKEEDYRKGEC